MTGKWCICPICDGDGTYVNPNIDGNGLTADDFNDDPDFAEAYFGGAYDVTCSTCNGRGSILAAQRQEIVEELAQAAEDRRMAAMEDGDFEAYCYAGDYRYGV
jgi:RecJ-like exonuclease